MNEGDGLGSLVSPVLVVYLGAIHGDGGGHYGCRSGGSRYMSAGGLAV